MPIHLMSQKRHKGFLVKNLEKKVLNEEHEFEDKFEINKKSKIKSNRKSSDSSRIANMIDEALNALDSVSLKKPKKEKKNNHAPKFTHNHIGNRDQTYELASILGMKENPFK